MASTVLYRQPFDAFTTRAMTVSPNPLSTVAPPHSLVERVNGLSADLAKLFDEVNAIIKTLRGQ